MKSPLVTVIYSPVGQGHRSAALSIADAIARRRADVEVAVVDVLAFAPRAFRYDLAWRLIQRHGGALWDWLFDVTDRAMPGPLMRLRERIDRQLLAPLAEHLGRRQPDRIVCTHYLPAVIVGGLARSGRLRGRTSTVVTDYIAHEAWINPGIDRYYVATDDVARTLAGRRVPAGAIETTGIPIRREMSEAAAPPSPSPAWPGAPLRVLFLASGVPRPLLREALASLAGARLDLQLVAGGDPGLRELLNGWTGELGIAGTVHGCLPTLKPLIDGAEVVVTKAGGLVVSECFARGRAMVLPWPAPGQERGNRAHAVATGSARTLDTAGELGAALDQLARQPERLLAMGLAAARASAPDAADRIARDLLRDLPAAAHRAAPLWSDAGAAMTAALSPGLSSVRSSVRSSTAARP